MMTRNERMLRRAELDAMARGRFDEMFPGCLDALDALTDMVERSMQPKPDSRLLFSAGGRHYRPQAEYDRALRKLSGNVTPFSLPEMYRLMDFLEIPENLMHEFFPKNGGVKPRKKAA